MMFVAVKENERPGYIDPKKRCIVEKSERTSIFIASLKTRAQLSMRVREKGDGNRNELGKQNKS